ncbi:MAG: hypothetical protein JNJ57_00790 [Saprospiraceae bacterium]|nr:hypothetical protein [Saprospiraceae bacterium]
MKTIEILKPPFLLDRKRLGGKGANLASLLDLGFDVPPFVVIPADCLSEIMPQKHEIETTISFIRAYKFPAEMLDAVEAAFDHARTKLFAVRSSGLAEDGAKHSFAGQFKTELFVEFDQIAEAVRSVWLSAFESRVLHYASERRLAWAGEISIIIQEMVDAKIAGVGFGVHPTEGWRDASVISAVYGLGEGLVSGELDADTFTVRDGKIDRQIVDKTKGMFFDRHQKKLSLQPVPAGLVSKPSLTDEQVFELNALIQKLNRRLGCPQDIEFAFSDAQKLYLLQTRPVTGLELLPDRSAHRIVWDNSNIIESYPGVTTPLTFSFIIKMYEAVYRQMAEIMGVPEKVRESEREVFANMLGLLRGRVYYNLEGWYRALAMLPGYQVNARFMETMMGVKERFDIPAQKSGGFQSWARLIWSVFKMLGLLFGLNRSRSQFKKVLDGIIAEYKKLDFDRMRPEESMRRYLYFEQFLLKKWKAPLVNDFFAMIYFGLLKKSAAKIDPNHIGLHNDLLAGSHDIISTEPFRRIMAISKVIHSNSEARTFFLENQANTIWQEISRFPEIEQRVHAYLDDFGERTVGELKLETITYAQQPSNFISILQSYARQPLPERQPYDETEVRSRAEAAVNHYYRFSPFRKWFFYGLLKKTRKLVSSRENLRYERTRGFGVVRRIFSGIGRQFASEGMIESQRDIFFLTKEEIFDFIKGTSVHSDIRSLIKDRKNTYLNYENEPPLPERITTFGTVYHANRFDAVTVTKSTDSSSVLKGLGCSAGVVRGRVRVVRTPDELESLQGDILVTSSTDPGWVTLFPSAGAILVERGSLLSHSAIVSRELGIPCVVGITGLLSMVKTGDLVEMNGTTGEILILNQELPNE